MTQTVVEEQNRQMTPSNETGFTSLQGSLNLDFTPISKRNTKINENTGHMHCYKEKQLRKVGSEKQQVHQRQYQLLEGSTSKHH
jgi:hypothetical protein